MANGRIFVSIDSLKQGVFVLAVCRKADQNATFMQTIERLEEARKRKEFPA